MKNSKNGPFVSMPQSKGNDGNFYDIACPLSGDLRKQISAAVLGEYSIAAEKAANEKQSVVDNLRVKSAEANARNAVLPQKTHSASHGEIA